MRLAALEQLARDIADNLSCNCYTEDLESDDCPCGGDGRDLNGNSGAFEGCWHCQALAALGMPEESSEAGPAKSEPAPPGGEDGS